MSTIQSLTAVTSLPNTAVLPVVISGETQAKKATIADVKTAVGAAHLPVDVRGSGAAYPLTATPAQLTNLGSCLVSGRVGDIFDIEFQVQVVYNGATFAAQRDVTLGVYYDDGTPAPVTNGSLTLPTDVTTTRNGLMALFTYKFPYQLATASDLLKLYGSVAVVPTAGSLDAVASGTFIRASRSVAAAV